MGYTKKFLSGETYSAQDVNSVFSALTTQGVSLFNYSDGDSPLISIDEAISSFTSQGLELYNRNACKVTYDSGTGIFKISQGNAWFIDGSFLTIDSSGVNITEKITEIRKYSTSDIYVYFKRDVANNDILIVADTSTINYKDESCVALAIVKNDNSIVDLRKISKSKLAPCSNNIYDKNTLNINVRISSNDRDGKKIADIPSSMISYAEYLLLNNTTLLEIQKADIEDLVYTSKELQLMTIGLAVREADTGYEIYARWESGSSQSYEIVNYLIF